MPKCEVDSVLLNQMQRFISDNQLTVGGAATRLGVGRTTLWRFCDSGKARDDTKILYRESLAKQGVKVADVADVAVMGGLLGQSRLALQGVLAERELKMIRKACEGVLALLDVYEARQLGRKI